MLRKDDSFKVVLNPANDPGADKRGLSRSGQALSRREDTGGADSQPGLRDYTPEGASIGATQLIQFSRTSLDGQTLGGAESVPIAEGLRSGDADGGNGDYAPGLGDVEAGRLPGRDPRRGQ